MKKSLISILGALAVFAGCTKENENYGFIVPEGKELVKIIATAEQSRTTVDINDLGANYAWNFGDTLAVVEEDADCPSKFTLVDAATGTFAGVKTEGKSLVFAITPEAFVTSGVDAGGTLQEFSVSLPDFYFDYVPGTTNAVMFGTPAEATDNGYRFYFRHAAAVIKVRYENVPKGTAGLCLTTDKVITGSWFFDSLDDVVLTTTSQGSNSVYLMLEKPVSLPNQSLDFYVPVPVGEYGSLSITLVDENMEELPETIRSKQANFSLGRGNLFTTPVVTLPEESLAGSYIIVSKAATKGNWVVMQAAVNDKGRWLYDESEHSYTDDVNLDDSSVDFAEFSNIAYKFDVLPLEAGGYILRNAQSGNYVQFAGKASNEGKEVPEGEQTAFQVFKVNANGSWTIGDWYSDTDFYSLQYNVNNFFTFYKTDQAGIYLIPYVGAAAPVKLSGSFSRNTVTLTAIPAESEIRFTTDGSEPDVNSTPYEGPFSITESCTVKAIAFAPNSDYTDSDILELECTYVEPGTGTYYEKVTTAPTDWTGDYLIVYEADEAKVLAGIGGTDSKPYGADADVEISDDAIEATEDIAAYNIEIKAGNTEGTYTMKLGDIYLAYTGSATSGNNYLYGVSDASTDGTEWYLSVDDAQNAYNTSRYLRYNTGSPRFSCYVSGQQKISFYKLSDARTPLDTPDGLSVSGMEVSWSPVNNAETYTVTVGSTVASVESNSYTYEGEAGYYTVSVVAVPASGSAYRESEAAVLEDVKFGEPKLATPVLVAGACTMDSVSATWDAIDNATEGYTVYIYVKGAQEPLYGGWTVTDCEANFTQLESGTEYTITVYANEVVDGNRVYLASDVATLDISTTTGTTTIADAIAGCDAGKSFTIEGVTVLVTPTTENAIIGDDSGCMVLYKKGGHGLSVGDVITIAGATARYGNVPEFIPESIYTTASGTEVSHGDPVSLTSDMLENWKSNNFNVTYVRASGSKSGRNVTIGDNKLYLNPASNVADGMVNVSGYVYGWASKFSNFNFATVTIKEDTTAPTLSVTPKVKNWAYNDTSAQEFQIDYSNGTLSISPDTIDWADINPLPTGSGISVAPKNENTTQTKREAILTVTVTPNSSNYEAISVEISLSQGINSGSGGDPVTVSMDSFSATSGYVNGDENVFYEASKGAAATAPAVNGEQIRIYQNGGLLTITANNGKTITNVTIGSAMATSVQVSIDGGSFSSDNSITAGGTYSTGTISASSSVVFKCTGTSKTARLYLNQLSVTYE